VVEGAEGYVVVYEGFSGVSEGGEPAVVTKDRKEDEKVKDEENAGQTCDTICSMMGAVDVVTGEETRTQGMAVLAFLSGRHLRKSGRAFQITASVSSEDTGLHINLRRNYPHGSIVLIGRSDPPDWFDSFRERSKVGVYWIRTMSDGKGSQNAVSEVHALVTSAQEGDTIVPIVMDTESLNGTKHLPKFSTLAPWTPMVLPNDPGLDTFLIVPELFKTYISVVPCEGGIADAGMRCTRSSTQNETMLLTCIKPEIVLNEAIADASVTRSKRRRINFEAAHAD
jgi:hypothetical protein